jgi:hypothetical protein
VSRCRDGQIPGSGETRPNPVICAMPTHPDHTSAPAGAARTSSGQDRTVLVRGRTAVADRSAAGPPVRSSGRPFRTGPSQRSAAGRGQVMTAVTGITARPAW